jgi:starch-binding outer membrane protein, SusD/RagB family
MYMHVKGCNNIKSFVVIALLVLTGSTACKKLVQVDLPDDQLETGIVFSNDSLANAAVVGLHSNIMSQIRHLFNGGMTVYAGLSADELKRNSPPNDEDQFLNNSLSTTNAIIGNNIWKAAYSYLYHCNISLEGLQRSGGVSEPVKKRLTAEVKFVRALCFFYLVNLFGDVPLVTTSNADKNALLPRFPIDTIYRQIKSDLLEADADLPDAIENTRPNKMACQALLARVYLFTENWTEAETAATSVINSSRYSLSDLKNVFKSVSTETIFQWAPVLNQINSAEGRIFIPVSPSAVPVYTVTNNLLIAFEPGDRRGNNWLNTVQPINNGQLYTYPCKYKINVTPPDTPATEYNIVLRLAEQYLIRAEARAQLNKINEAVDDINIIRGRADLSTIPTSVNKSQCLAAIEQERRIELFAEWGHRWFDLKRLNRAHSVLNVLKAPTWQITDQLYPIPLSEIERDPYLVQNPGYNQ